MHKKLFLAFAIAILLIGAFFYFKPIFSVNGQIVFRPEFEANLKAAVRSEKKFEEKNPGLPTGADLGLAAAQRILEMHLVREELWRQVDSKTLNPILTDKVDSALANPNFIAAAQDLYGFNAALVKKYIVLPQAEEDILKSKLLLQGKNFGDWLSAAKKSAQVKIYFSNLKWSNSTLGK